MTEATQALNEMKDIYASLLGHPAPEIGPGWYAPFPPGVDPLRFAIQELEDLKQLRARITAPVFPVAWVPRADVFALEDALVIRVEIPGASREGLKVLVERDACIVRGERKPFENAKEVRPLGVECPYGPFERRFPLPARADADRLTARCVDGVLELRIPVLALVGEAKEMTVEIE
jgi:HSP20 family protein